MTKSQLAEKNVYLNGKTFDYALPEPWIRDMNETYKIPYSILIFCFVWLYDESAKTFGRPYPLNIAGWVACKMGGIEWT